MYPTNYDEASAILGNRKRRKVAHNTYLNDLRVNGKGAIVLTYHATDVVQFMQSGSVQLETAGWKTVTTKKRFNECGFAVWQTDSEWFFTNEHGTFSCDRDSLSIAPDGHVYSEGCALVPLTDAYRTANNRRKVTY
jgi:hypothetical protein